MSDPNPKDLPPQRPGYDNGTSIVHPLRPLPMAPFRVLPRTDNVQVETNKSRVDPATPSRDSTSFSDNGEGTPPPLRFWDDHKNPNAKPTVIAYKDLPTAEFLSTGFNRMNNGRKMIVSSAKERKPQDRKENAKTYTPVKPLRKRPVFNNLPDQSSSTAKDQNPDDGAHNFDLGIAGKYDKRTIASMSTLTEPCARSIMTELSSQNLEMRDSQCLTDSSFEEDIYSKTTHDNSLSTDAAKYSGKYASVASFLEPLCPDTSSVRDEPSSSDAATSYGRYATDAKSACDDPSSSDATTFEESLILDSNLNQDEPPCTPVEVKKGRESSTTTVEEPFSRQRHYRPSSTCTYDGRNVEIEDMYANSPPREHRHDVVWSPKRTGGESEVVIGLLNEETSLPPTPPPKSPHHRVRQEGLQSIQSSQPGYLQMPQMYSPHDPHAEAQMPAEHHQFHYGEPQSESGSRPTPAAEETRSSNGGNSESSGIPRPQPTYYPGNFVPPLRPVTPPVMPAAAEAFMLLYKSKEHCEIATKLTEAAVKEGDVGYFFKALVPRFIKGGSFLDALRRLNTTLGELTNLLESWPMIFHGIRQIQIEVPYTAVSCIATLNLEILLT
jgi:hypothetical protein